MIKFISYKEFLSVVMLYTNAKCFRPTKIALLSLENKIFYDLVKHTEYI